MTGAQFALFDTPIGSCGIAWNDHGIVALQLPAHSARATRARVQRMVPGAVESPPPQPLRHTITSIRDLLSGRPADLSGAVLDMSAVAPFYRRVYEAARRIPPGDTMSYGAIATAIGAPGSARAVGQALGRNPFALIVPCHRVVAANGKLGGFSATGGVTTKATLLHLESPTTPDPALKEEPMATTASRTAKKTSPTNGTARKSAAGAGKAAAGARKTTGASKATGAGKTASASMAAGNGKAADAGKAASASKATDAGKTASASKAAGNGKAADAGKAASASKTANAGKAASIGKAAGAGKAASNGKAAGAGKATSASKTANAGKAASNGNAAGAGKATGAGQAADNGTAAAAGGTAMPVSAGGGRQEGYGFDPKKALAHLRKADPKLGAFIDRAGPFEMVINPADSVFGMLAEAIIYQQLTAKAAATIFGRVCEATSGGKRPKPKDVLATSHEDLRAAGLSNAKALALLDLAAKAESGELPTLAKIKKLPDDEIIETLVQVRGVGRWTAEMFLIFRLGRPDVLPLDDYGLRRGYTIVFGTKDLPTKAELTEAGEKWAPYRTAASWYLWKAAE